MAGVSVPIFGLVSCALGLRGQVRMILFASFYQPGSYAVDIPSIRKKDMRVTYIKLHKYKRFPLSHASVFEHHFTKKLTMILGPNGAGKSSLIEQLSPLPPDKDDFYSGGFKEIDIEHNGYTYKLLSDFTTSSAKYFFYQDGENLNASNNISTQRELAFQHFSLVPIVQDLLTGAETFTEMSLISRKKLFNAITHLNIEAILENYNGLKDKLKNQEFLLKNTTSLLMTEKQKLSDTSRIESLSRQKSQCRHMLETLLRFRTELHQYSITGDLEASQRAFNTCKRHWDNIYEAGYMYLTSYPYEALANLREQSVSAISQAKTQLQSHYQRIEHLDQQIDAVRLLQLQDSESLQTRFNQLNLEKVNTQTSLRYLTQQDYTDQSLSQVLMLEHSLPDVIHQLPANPDKALGKSQYQELTTQRVALVVELNQLLQQEVNDTQLRQELLEHANYNCPSCSHSWLPEEVQDKLKKVEQSLVQTKERKANMQLRVQLMAEPIAKQEAYLEIFSQFVNLFNATKAVLGRFWSQVLDNEVLYTNPNDLSAMLRQLVQDANGCARLVEIDTQLKSVSEKLSLLKDIGEQSLQELQEQRSSQEEAIERCHICIDTQNRHLCDYESARHYYERLAHLSALLAKSKQAVQTQHLHHTVFALVQETDDELSKLKVQMIEIDKELTSHHLVERMVATYEAQITQIQEEVKVLTILTDELSPKNGFIAKSISHFLNVIIGSINTEISKVWEYKMQLKVIDVAEDSLNYKFKVVVEDRLEIEDVSKVSSGMKEMINLGMKKTLFKLLRLEHYPMYLDELAANLDQQHTEKIVHWIQLLIASETYSQVFLITHKENFSFLRDVELIEL